MIRSHIRRCLLCWLILTVSVISGTAAYVGMRQMGDDRSATAGAMGVAMVALAVLRVRFWYPRARSEDERA